MLQARLDFDRSKLTCRAMAEKMAETAGGQLGWSQMAEGMALRDAVSSTDAVSAIEQAETRRGNDGVPWVGGSNAGGAGQSAIRVVGDVTRAGYNLVNGRSVTDTSSIAPASCASLSCQTWTSPQQATEWATRVLGEQVQRTCDSCTKTETVPGVRLTPLIQEEYETKLEALQELVSGTRNTTFENLRAAGSTSLPITRGVIEALRDEPDQDLLARRLASEVALSSVLEKALLLQRTLLTGKKEPNVAANQLAVEAVNHESDTLDQEIRNLKTELNCGANWRTTRPWPSSSATGRARPARAASTKATRCPTASIGCSRGNPGHAMNAAWLRPRWLFSRRAAKALLLAVVIIAAAVGANLVGIYLVGSVAGWGAVAGCQRGLLPGVAAVPVRRDGLWLGLDAPPAAGPRGRRASAATPGAQRDRRRRRHRGAGSQPADAELKREPRHDAFTTDYPEYYLTLVSWIVNNGIWAVLVSSGVFALPFVAIIVQEWLKARAEGADEGNKGVLSAARIENRVFVAIVVVMFAGIPFIDVDLNTIQYDSSRSAQCQVSVPQPTDTGWSQSFSTINNQSAKVPVWWAFMHALSRAVTSASVAAIPWHGPAADAHGDRRDPH